MDAMFWHSVGVAHVIPVALYKVKLRCNIPRINGIFMLGKITQNMPKLNQYVPKCVENGSYKTLVVNNNYGYIQVCIYTILFTSIVQIEIGAGINYIVVTNMTKNHSIIKCNFETHNYM
jgi:hypothetical protein